MVERSGFFCLEEGGRGPREQLGGIRRGATVSSFLSFLFFLFHPSSSCSVWRYGFCIRRKDGIVGSHNAFSHGFAVRFPILFFFFLFFFSLALMTMSSVGT